MFAVHHQQTPKKNTWSLNKSICIYKLYSTNDGNKKLRMKKEEKLWTLQWLVQIFCNQGGKMFYFTGDNMSLSGPAKSLPVNANIETLDNIFVFCWSQQNPLGKDDIGDDQDGLKRWRRADARLYQT